MCIDYENMNAYSVQRHRHTPEIEQELAVLGADRLITFTPHLIPLDQGELVTCYVTPTDGGLSRGDAQAIYLEAYADEAFVEVVSTPGSAPCARRTSAGSPCTPTSVPAS